MDSFLDALRPLKAAQKSDPGSRSNALSGGSGSGPGSRSNALSGGSGGNDMHDSWGAPRDAAPEPAAGAGDDGWNDNDWDDDDSWGKAAPKAKAKETATC